jgi:hypothetical protein
MPRDERRVGPIHDDELVRHALGIREAEAVARALGGHALAGEPLLPEVERRGRGDARDDAVHHAGARSPGDRAGVLEEREVGTGAAQLVGVEQMVDARIVLVDRLLDEPHTEDASVEIDVAGCVARDRRDVMDAFKLHEHPLLQPQSGRLAAGFSGAPADTHPRSTCGSSPSLSSALLIGVLCQLRAGKVVGILRAHALLALARLLALLFVLRLAGFLGVVHAEAVPALRKSEPRGAGRGQRDPGLERRARRHTARMNSHTAEVPAPEPPPHPQPTDPPPTAAGEDEVKEREQEKLDIGDSHPEDRDIRPKPTHQGDDLDVGDPYPADRDTEPRT